MNKRIKLVTAVVALLMVAAIVVTFEACKKNILQEIEVKELDEQQDQNIIENILLSDDTGIPFPAGSKAYIKENNEYLLTLPQGYYWVVQSVENRSLVSEVSEVSFRCICEEGDINKCYPVCLKGTYFCAMENGCHTCHRENVTANNGNLTGTEIQVLGLINRNVGITIITDQPIPKENDKFVKLPISNMDVIHGNAFEALFQLEDVLDYFNSIVTESKNKNVELNTYTFLNIFGNLVLAPLAENMDISINNTVILPKSIPAGSSVETKISCNCTSGNSGCKLEQKSFCGLKLYYCDTQGCTSCVMNGPEQ